MHENFKKNWRSPAFQITLLMEVAMILSFEIPIDGVRGPGGGVDI
jgi:hypothetical protein